MLASRYIKVDGSGWARPRIGRGGRVYDLVVTSRSRRPHDDPTAEVEFSAADVAGLRKTQLELLAEFDRVCSMHELPYFALYGTALGAVRHGGFIPWDDDIDVGMLRPDYDRLMKLIDNDLGERYFFQTVESDPHYGAMFGKLRKNGTRFIDRVSEGSPQHGGIFLDVFPLDAKATGRWTRHEQKVMRYVGFRLLYLKAGYHLPMRNGSFVARLALVVARGVVRVTPRPWIIALTRRHARLNRTSSPDKYVSLFGAYFYDRDTVDAGWLHPLRTVPFETATIPVLGNVEAYLTQIYGNYMQPPPLEQRVGHHEIVELDFGPRQR